MVSEASGRRGPVWAGVESVGVEMGVGTAEGKGKDDASGAGAGAELTSGAASRSAIAGGACSVARFGRSVGAASCTASALAGGARGANAGTRGDAAATAGPGGRCGLDRARGSRGPAASASSTRCGSRSEATFVCPSSHAKSARVSAALMCRAVSVRAPSPNAEYRARSATSNAGSVSSSRAHIRARAQASAAVRRAACAFGGGEPAGTKNAGQARQVKAATSAGRSDLAARSARSFSACGGGRESRSMCAYSEVRADSVYARASVAHAARSARGRCCATRANTAGGIGAFLTTNGASRILTLNVVSKFGELAERGR